MIETYNDWITLFETLDLEAILKGDIYIPLEIDMDHILMTTPDLALDLFLEPDLVIQQGEAQLSHMMGPGYFQNKTPFIRIYNLPENYQKTISSLTASDIGRLVQIRGQINVRSRPLQRIQMSVDICTSCGTEMITWSSDGYLEGPYECVKEEGGCGKRIGTTRFKQDPLRCVYMDYISMEVEDVHDMDLDGSPEKLKMIIEGDLTNDKGRPEPGDRIVITGIYKQKKILSKDGIRKDVGEPYIRVVHVSSGDKSDLTITSADIEIFNEKKDEALNLIKRSIAPTIYGYDNIRLGVALALFGGVTGEKIDGSYRRGEIHVHLNGPPATGKSQLLAGALRLAPRGKKASGKSTTGVGLVGAVVKDQYSDGQYTLRAGVLAKSDRGHAWVDEVDKLSEEDRDNLRESMEAGEVPINKGGISAILKARTTVFLASNPPGEQFDLETDLSVQNTLSKAIRSRIDLEYYLLNNEDPQVIQSIVEIMNRSLMNDESLALAWDRDIIRKYIHYARSRIDPDWMEEATHKLEREASNILWESSGDPRQITTLHRLAEASARSRLSKKVTASDVALAIHVLRDCLQSHKVGLMAEVRRDLIQEAVTV